MDQPIVTPGGGSDSMVRIAASQTGYLVVWAGNPGDTNEVLVAKLDASGRLLDTTAQGLGLA